MTEYEELRFYTEESFNNHEITQEDKEYFLERLETMIAHPFVSRKTLYHGSAEKMTKIMPYSYNAGTRFSHPRMSSFWTGTYKLAQLMGLWRAVCYIPDEPFDYIFDIDHNCLIFKKSDEKAVVQTLSSMEYYVYTYNADMRFVGAGHDKGIDEFTIDVPVKPDKMDIHKIKNEIKSGLIAISSDSWMKDTLKDRHFAIMGGFDHSFLKGLVYHDNFSKITNQMKLGNVV